MALFCSFMCYICHLAMAVSSIKQYSYKKMVKGYRTAMGDSVPFPCHFWEGNTKSNVKHLVKEIMYLKWCILHRNSTAFHFCYIDLRISM